MTGGGTGGHSAHAGARRARLARGQRRKPGGTRPCYSPGSVSSCHTFLGCHADAVLWICLAAVLLAAAGHAANTTTNTLNAASNTAATPRVCRVDTDCGLGEACVCGRLATATVPQAAATRVRPPPCTALPSSLPSPPCFRAALPGPGT